MFIPSLYIVMRNWKSLSASYDYGLYIFMGEKVAQPLFQKEKRESTKSYVSKISNHVKHFQL